MVFGLRLKPLAVNLAVLFAAFLFMFLLLEAYFRVFDPQNVEDTVLNPYYLWAHSPGHVGRLKSLFPGEYDTVYNINSRGLRDFVYNYSKSEKFRVLVLGDSFTEGVGVNMEDTYPKVLERMLGTDFEVINGGFKGFGPQEEMMFYRHELWNYSPDVVVLGFFLGNDIVDMGRPVVLSPVVDSGRLTLNETGVVFDTHVDFKSGIKRFLGRNSHVYVFVIESLIRSESISKFLFERGIFVPPPRPFSTYSRDWYESKVDSAVLLVKAFGRDLNRDNISLFVVLIPDIDQVYPSVYEGKLAQYNVTDPFDMDVANRRIMGVCSEEGLKCLDTTSYFRAHNDTMFFHRFDGHFNKAAHNITARLIYDEFSPYFVSAFSAH